jgi:hypothetical protein
MAQTNKSIIQPKTKQPRHPAAAARCTRLETPRAAAAAMAAVAGAAAPAAAQAAPPLLLLFDDPHSEYCAKVKVVLHHKGLAWETLPAKPCGRGGGSSGCGGGSGGESGGGEVMDFASRAPLGKIPALVVVDAATGQEEVSAAAAIVAAELELSCYRLQIWLLGRAS